MQNPPPAPQPEAAARLEVKSQIIQQRWEALAREEVAAARRHSHPALLDNFPFLLKDLHQLFLTGVNPEGLERLFDTAQDHANERAAMGDYSLAEVIREFHLLRRVLVDELSTEGYLHADAYRTIHLAVDLAIERSATRYVQATQREQAHLQSITDAALAHLSLEDLLPALVERVSAGLRGETAAILLRDGDELVVHAAVGLEADEARRVRIPVGQGFAGQVAAEGRMVAWEDVDPAKLFSPALREEGVRSLLGVPLEAEGELLGVLHVGSLLPRHFSEHERQLLQLAAVRASFAVDHARLVTQLQLENQRKNEFLALLAHEVRTPLSAITNALYVLSNMEIADERAARQLQSMQRQIRQLSRLVEDLGNISRIEQGRLMLQMEPVALERLAADAAEGVGVLLESRGQQLHCDLSPEPIMVYGDPARLTQVITNLLNNAVTYTEPGGAIWFIVEREGDEAVVRVRDSGIGIDPPLLPQIFDMFHQAAPVERRTAEGMGIGLAIVKRLVQLHHGEISAHSEGRGYGSEFVVRLPLASAETR